MRSLLAEGILEPVTSGFSVRYHVTVPSPIAYLFESRFPLHVGSSPERG
jgi:hypothetical protein